MRGRLVLILELALQVHDATAREKLDKALFRNMDTRRKARVSKESQPGSPGPVHRAVRVKPPGA